MPFHGFSADFPFLCEQTSSSPLRSHDCLCRVAKLCTRIFPFKTHVAKHLTSTREGKIKIMIHGDVSLYNEICSCDTYCSQPRKRYIVASTTATATTCNLNFHNVTRFENVRNICSAYTERPTAMRTLNVTDSVYCLNTINIVPSFGLSSLLLYRNVAHQKPI